MRTEALITLLAMLVLAAYVHAQQGADTDVIRTGTITESGAGNATAGGGNVTMMNLSSVQSTTRWQGYYGNVSGSLSLGFGSSIFYDFTSAAVGAVFASHNQSFSFGSLSAGSAADVDSVWGFASGPDRAVSIYTGTSSIQGISAPSVELEPAGSNFNSTILDDGNNAHKASFAFGVNVQSARACFDGTLCEYELMVPVSGTETYYFFVAIS